jgi:thiamine transport system ATP-binding protein
VVDPAGPLQARVLEARITPDQVRLVLDVEGLGTLGGVTDPAHAARVGEVVRVAVRTDRLAPLPA